MTYFPNFELDEKEIPINMKTIIAILNHPVIVIMHALLGAGMMLYLQELTYQAVLWFLPCCFVILADLASGIPAARFRGEKVTFSTACRQTLNKTLCYLAWTLFACSINQLYDSHMPTLVGMGIIFLIEACSFFGNILEPKGYELSIKGILHVIGRRHDTEGLENIVEKKKDHGTH